MIMEPPPGYPPPTLVRKRGRVVSARAVIVFLLLFAGLGWFIVNSLLDRAPPPPPAVAGTDASGAGDADSDAAVLPDTTRPGAPRVIVERPIEDGAAAGEAFDARKPNQWYFVDRLGDGPGAIYSRDGGQWSFAFACTTRTRMIEFIALGTGSPGAFVDQAIDVGKVKLAMEATYSKHADGTISTTLPASHPFFNALDGSTPMEIQLVADRKTIVPVGPAVVRLIRDCRGRA